MCGETLRELRLGCRCAEGQAFQCGQGLMPAGSSEMGRRGELGADPPRDELRMVAPRRPVLAMANAICGRLGG